MRTGSAAEGGRGEKAQGEEGAGEGACAPNLLFSVKLFNGNHSLARIGFAAIIEITEC